MASHTSKRQHLGLWARIGGAFNRAFFVLEIRGDDLNPEEVTKLLGINPSKSYRKGDETRRGAQFRRTGGWFLDSGEIRLSDEDLGDAKFESWLQNLPSDRVVWDLLHSQFKSVVRVAVYTDQMNAEFALTPEAANELYKRGLALLFDPYLELDDDAP